MHIPRRLQRRLASLLFSLALLLVYSLADWALQAAPPPPGGTAMFYSTHGSHDLRLTYAQAIQRAEKSILLMIYGLSDQRVLAALRERAAAGVEVTILYDPKASRQLPEKLEAPITLIPRLSKGLMHQKILVIDQSEVWIGSANMTQASLRHHANLCMGVHAEALAEAIEHRASLMRQNTRLPGRDATVFPLADKQELSLWWLPNAQALDRLEELIDSAKKTVRVAMYTWTHPRLSSACVRAHERGVDVKLVIDGEAAAGAGSKVTEELKNAGLALRLSKGPALLHHKFAIIDTDTLVHGSANWTRSAFKRNDEVLCIQTPLSPSQRENVLGVWQRAWNQGRTAF